MAPNSGGGKRHPPDDQSLNDRYESAKRTLAKLIDRHMTGGSRPAGNKYAGQAWGSEDLGEYIGKDERTVRNYRTGRSAPEKIADIEIAFFGVEASKDTAEVRAARNELREAHQNLWTLEGQRRSQAKLRREAVETIDEEEGADNMADLRMTRKEAEAHLNAMKKQYSGDHPYVAEAQKIANYFRRARREDKSYENGPLRSDRSTQRPRLPKGLPPG
jgi:hypothetical protein